MDTDEGEVVYPTISKTVTLPLVEMKKGFSYIYKAYLDEANVADPEDPNFPEGLNPIQFTVEEVKKWDDATDDDTYQFIPIGNITSEDDVQLYDLALSDGSFVRVWDDDADKLAENIANLTEAQKAAIKGVVYWLESEADETTSLSNDPVLKRDYPDCNHGLIVALDELEDIVWSKNDEYWICNEFQRKSDVYGNLDRYAYIDDGKVYAQHSNGKGNYDNTNKILGYNNTTVLKAYNEQISETYQKVLVVEPLENFNKGNRINGTSGWYVPSIKELALLVTDEQITNEWENVSNYNYSTRNNNLSCLYVALTTISKLFTEKIDYWSSTEDVDDDAWCIYQDNGSIDYIWSGSTKSCKGNIRLVCAF
jgi:hypothetical protein